MITLIFIISVIVFVVCVFYCNFIDDDFGLFCLSALGGIISIISTIIAFAFLIDGAGNYISWRNVDDKIAMYQEENKAIEQDIKYVVEQSRSHENDTYRDILDNPTALAIAFPELKSNELASKQIDLYVKNNDKIKSLKLKKIERENYAFWLFFG